MTRTANTMKATKSEAKKATSTQSSGIEIPAILTYRGADALVSRKDEYGETHKKGDSSKVMTEKDSRYISRLQDLIAEMRRRMEKEGADPLLSYIIGRALLKVRMYAEHVCRTVISGEGMTEDAIEQTAEDFQMTISKGCYKGKSPTAYIKSLTRSSKREAIQKEHALSWREQQAMKLLYKLESICREQGKDPEDITPEERYEWLVRNGLCEKTANEFKTRTSESFKKVSSDNTTDSDTKSVWEDKYPFIEESDTEGFFAQFKPEDIAESPWDNKILCELYKEGRSKKELFEASLYLMELGYQYECSKIGFKRYEKSITRFSQIYSEEILKLYEKIMGVEYEGKTPRKTQKSKEELQSAQARYIVLCTLNEFKIESELMEAIREIMLLLYNEAKEYAKESVEYREMYNELFG